MVSSGLAAASGFELDPFHEGYSAALKDLYALCVSEGSFALVGVDGSEKKFLCIEQKGVQEL